MRVVIVNGRPRAGKDKFSEYCLKANGDNGAITSMADAAKDIAKEAGWDGQKNPKNRKFLSDLKDLIDEWNDCSFKWVKEFVEDQLDYTFYFGLNTDDRIVFVMAREPDDIEHLKNYFNAVTICLRRNDVELNLLNTVKNHADEEVFDYAYDYHIDNNGSFEDLEAAAAAFVEELKGDNVHVWNG